MVRYVPEGEAKFCYAKIPYDDKKKAREVAARVRKRTGNYTIKPYRCRSIEDGGCGRWHIGSHQPGWGSA